MTIGPLIFSFYAFAHLAFAVVALSLVPAAPLPALALFVVEAITAYDNLIIVLGRRIGTGASLLRLNRMRFFLHAVCIGFLVPVYIGIANFLNVPGFASAAGQIAGWLAAILIGVFGLSVQYRKLELIMPINYYGCLRYAQAVDAVRRWPGYDYSEAELAQRPFPPFASIITVLIGLGVSFWTGWSADFWMPFAATALMFCAAGLPPRTWGPLATSAIEIVFSGTLVYSLTVVV